MNEDNRRTLEELDGHTLREIGFPGSWAHDDILLIWRKDNQVLTYLDIYHAEINGNIITPRQH